MPILALLLLALQAFAQVPTVDSFSQIPGIAKSGQPVKLRIRLTGPADRLFITLDGTSTQVPFSSIGNNTWEAEITAPQLDPRMEYFKFLGIATIGLRNESTSIFNVVLKVDSGDLPMPAITTLAPDARRTNYVVNLVLPSFFLTNPSGNYQGFSIENASRRFYQLFNDDFDFLHFVAAGPTFPQNRFHARIKGDVQGIGAQLVDASASFGSRGKLIGFTMFPSTTFIDGADEAVSHETGHQWMMYSTRGLLANGFSHWPMSSMATGIMGYSDPTPGASYQGLLFPCRFTAQPDGGYSVSFALGVQTFNDMDLYFMGLMPASEVRSQFVITDPAKVTEAIQRSCAMGRLSASQIQNLSIADVIALNGPRVPAFPNTQRDFRVATILVTRDAPLSDDEMAFYDHFARRVEAKVTMPVNAGRLTAFTNPWAVTTQGRSRLTSLLTSSVQPEIAPNGIVNAASFSAKALTPGAVATVFGTAFTTETASATSVPLPTTLGGVTVRVNGVAVPLFYVSPTQINFQLPSDLKTARTIPGDPAYLARVRVHNATGYSLEAFIESYVDAPGIIAYADNQAVATDQQNRVIGPGNPAKPGDVITVYFVGSSSLAEVVPAGARAPADRLVPVTVPSRALLDNAGMQISFIGLTPGSVGLLQANLRIPPGTTPGSKTLQIFIGPTASNSVKLSVAN
jgi:uncharacterized protein (TIGR03437 family)